MKKNLRKHDAVIIGLGKGGKTMAGTLGAAGKIVALIEHSSMMYGGTCISVGYTPTKSLVYRAGLAAAVGKTFEEKSTAYREAMEQKGDPTGKLREKNYQKLDNNPNITVIDGNARFVSSHIVEVAHNEDVSQVGGEMIFINTESQAFIPPVGGLKGDSYVYTSEGLLNRRELSEKLVIIGGGYTGAGFSSIYANFGSKVTILQDGDVFLPREDGEIAATVKASLENRRIHVLAGVKVRTAEREESGAVVVIDTREGERRLRADTVLVVTGRRPSTKGLNLEAAGVRIDTRGGIITDDTLTTTASHIYTMGDVRGGLQFTYISLGDFRIVRSTVLGDGNYDLKERGAIPCSVFPGPPFSRMGLSEKEAIKTGYRVKTARPAATAIPKVQVLEQPTRLLKAVIDEETGLILGAHLFCEESYKMINIVELTMDVKISYTVLRNAIHTHPTMSEAFNDLSAV